MNDIIYSIKPRNYEIILETKNLEVMNDDRQIKTTTYALLYRMKLLTSKYNNLGYPVLFEID